MTNAHESQATQTRTTTLKPQFKRKPLAAFFIAGLTLMSTSAFAAGERSQAEIQAEINNLEASLQKAKQELAATNNKPAATPATKPAENTKSNATKLSAVKVQGRRNQLEAQKDVPASVSIVSGTELDRLDATTITEVLNRIGNVNFNYGNPRTGSLTLRGITTGSNDQIDPTIGTLLDGVSIGYSPITNGYSFIDIDTVDVTRGPQGTQGGKPSNIGRISFKTKAPSFTPSAELQQTFGDWDTLRSTAILGGPVIDGLLAWRGTFQREQGKGPFINQFPDQEGRFSYKNQDRTFGRIQFLLTPNEDISAKLSVEFQPKGSENVNGLTNRHPEPTTFSDGVTRPASSVDATYKKYLRAWFNQDSTLWNTERDYYANPVNVDNNGSIITGSRGETLNINWDLGSVELQSITGHRSHWFSAANDEGTPFDITKSGGYITSYSQISQELKLVSEKGNWVDYQAGIYYLSTDNNSLGSRTRYGDDAGAFYASDALYNSLAASASGQALLRDSLNYAYKGPYALVKNESKAIFGEANWHLNEAFTLTTGARITQEERNTSLTSLIFDNGVGADLTNAFGGTTTFTDRIAGGEAASDRLASRYFGAAGWSALTAAQKTQLINAAKVRNGTLQPNSVFGLVKAPAWDGELYAGNLSLSDKISESLTVYGTVQYGEKGGIAQVSTTGVASLVDKERTTGYELGFRSSLLDKTLTLNADIFINDIKDFQTTVGVPDPVATAAYRAANPTVSLADSQQYQSVVGNLSGVRVKGIEIDAFYSGFENLTLRIATAYNDATYSENAFLAQPNEINSTTPGFNKFSNVKGEDLPNAPKFTTTLGANYSVPVFENGNFHASANYKYSSSYKTSRSIYDKFDAAGSLDLSVGLGTLSGSFDANIVVKNALDGDNHVEGWTGYTPSTPRWVGIIFTGKL
ncbi:TonB-dependent receptor [Cellvibrio zantedeschiae]|uniref:TonB-dependent receptor n=1 Tax=Cellvibrio zantedeschiae TaxID=1237077 RepID=A0ABQ3AZN0_9GAMM|nr:TonB-dependent receptor [Cellvibrio zantedeschiae]GGY71728.1 TonB-dependent receptor [Cellvibrio zantedeschiae]